MLLLTVMILAPLVQENLTIQSVTATTTGIACVRLSSNSTTGTDGADNNTVKNCIIIGSRSSATSTTVNYGIVLSNSTSITTGAYSSINTKVENNVITRCWHGIYANGESATYPNTGIQIFKNIIGTPENGVLMMLQLLVLEVFILIILL